MELPAALRQAVDRMLDGTALSDLQRAADLLSRRYRAEVRDGRLHLSDDLAAKAYLAARLPATYTAIRKSLEAVAEAQPDFAPATLLDLGSGPGSALWAAGECWASLDVADLVEASPAIRRVGEELARESGLSTVRWRAGDVLKPLPDLQAADLVTLAYVLDELPPSAIASLTDRLWALTAGTLVVIEPGTPAGWKRILAVRDRLIAAGAGIVAPCPHARACPLVEPDWCHFAGRVARSRIHRLTKGADVPWEDEKYIFVAASRLPPAPYAARVVAPPRIASGQVRLKLCRADGTAGEDLVTKRQGDAFKRARRADWGDAL
ncbi:small ribosomal subunit Rsm22 family protein [Microvirga pudoricolor]|uniref:small ribosomal subunit Rsm22 family protein n=1 Tax=Microvirga pudoricolor TaxID=2778729 RepID=UPI00195020CF|nr:small ribosomal subunit Rsm22 family protein [Microvirga pudoricolor]MBM6592652.1 SAM-dependent methyltransferase [Microvirga pudoricolor]